MQWSKVKKQIEGNFADSLKGRVEVHRASYRRAGDKDGRCWIAVDKEEVCSFCTLKADFTRGKLAHEIREANKTSNWQDPKQRRGYYAASDEAERISYKMGIYSRGEFMMSIREFLDLPIAESLDAANPILRALAVLDRRVGKRRLEKFAASQEKHPLVQAMLTVRMESERRAIE